MHTSTAKKFAAAFTTDGEARIERTGQSVRYIEILTATGVDRFRLTIHSNAYAEQSYGHVERWDGTRWHEVASTSGESLVVGRARKLYVMKDAELGPHLFAEDRERLLAYAAQIVF